MKTDHIFFIINPAAGKNEPVLEKIAAVFQDSDIQLTIHILKEKEDPALIAGEAAKDAGLIAVYGGDGSITASAAGLIGTKKPLAIIPGGTANVLAKELGIPQDTDEALQLIRDGLYHFKIMDTGIVNGDPFLLRVNLGIMAEMITETDPELKDKVGQLAYGISTIKAVKEAVAVDYHLTIDGKQETARGVALTVTNSGSMGIGDLQLWPGISISDGLLDVVLLKDVGLISVIKATGSALLGKETDAISHWACKEITIKLAEEQVYLCDDCEARTKELAIKVVPSSLIVAIPLNEKESDKN